MRTYLNIINEPNDGIRLIANDGVFASSGHFSNKAEFISHCESRRDKWLNSNLGNFDEFDNEYRKIIADKWNEAKELSEGYYNCYFNLEDIKTIFKNEVQELAKSLGIIDYNLTI